VDEIDVRLDVTYAEEKGKTTQYGAEFSESKTETRTQSHEATISASLSVSQEVEATAAPPAAKATVSTWDSFSREAVDRLAATAPRFDCSSCI